MKWTKNLFRTNNEEDKISNITPDEIFSKNHFFPIDQTEPEDVFIVGYPKSGNTWMQSIVAGLIYGIDPSFLPDKLAQELVPDVHMKSYYKRFQSFNCFKSHHLPLTEYKRVIYIVRDGRDAMVSYKRMHEIQDVGVTFDEMVKEGKGLFPGKWHEHVLTWKSNPYQSDMMFLKYEDLLSSPKTEIERICNFLKIDRSGELINTVIEGTRFDVMRKKEIQFGMENKNWKGDKKQKFFFRQGKSKVYKEEFSAELLTIFESESQEALRLFGYES